MKWTETNLESATLNFSYNAGTTLNKNSLIVQTYEKVTNQYRIALLTIQHTNTATGRNGT
jgi:hypothetical protein